jgi:putative toxin-antitoxin system antitoxin component (TIGR02293 family)
MSKTSAARPLPYSGRSKLAVSDQGVVRLSGHSFVTLLGLPTSDVAGLRERIQEGLNYRSWDRFLESTGLSNEAVIQVVQIPPRTLARRKSEGRLRPDESDRLVRAARIFSLAVDLFDGDVEAARRWLTQPQPALGGSTPWDYAATEIGAREVENLIGRLEYGIPS